MLFRPNPKQPNPSPNPSPNPAPNPAQGAQGMEAIALQPRMRGMLFGITESGKSTLAEALIRHWLRTNPNSHVLIVDPKPRFRAELELNGLTTARRYKHWKRGTTIPGSYLVPMRDPDGELRQVWRLGGRVAIAQNDEADEEALLYALRYTMRSFYGNARDRFAQLAYVDEVADFYGTSGQARRGDSLLKIVRSGREKNVAFLGASQRPKGVPKSLLTECTQYYCFQLANPDDVDHIREMKLPAAFAAPETDHVFAFYSRKSKLFIPAARLRTDEAGPARKGRAA